MTTCPLCGHPFRRDGSCECPAVLAGAGHRVAEVRRAETEPVVVTRVTGHGPDTFARIDVRLSPISSTDLDVRLANAAHALTLDDTQDGTR